MLRPKKIDLLLQIVLSRNSLLIFTFEPLDFTFNTAAADPNQQQDRIPCK